MVSRTSKAARRSASNWAASSSVKNACSASSSGRSNGVSVRKSQTPFRSGAPQGVRGPFSGASWAWTAAGANAMDTATTTANDDARTRLATGTSLSATRRSPGPAFIRESAPPKRLLAQTMLHWRRSDPIAPGRRTPSPKPPDTAPTPVNECDHANHHEHVIHPEPRGRTENLPQPLAHATPPTSRRPHGSTSASADRDSEAARYCPSKTYCTTDCNRPGSALKSRSSIGTEYEPTTSSTDCPAA